MLIALAIVAIIGLGSRRALAQTCSTTLFPYTLTNGATADASQVMADLNCAPIYGLANWGGNVGIGTTSPLSLLHLAALSPQLTMQSSYGTGGWYQDGTTGNALLVTDVGALTFKTGVAYNGSWLTGGTERVRISNNGNIGIGTTNPADIFDIQKPAGAGWLINTYVTGVPDYTGIYSNGTNDLLFAARDHTGAVQVNLTSYGWSYLTGGNFGIGTTAPTTTLYVNGSTTLTQGFSQSSDIRLKKDITPIVGALAIVEKLRGVRYSWRPPSERPVGKALDFPLNAPQLGFIAQEVEEALPEAVERPKLSGDGIYGLKENMLIPVLVQAIKEQQSEIFRLQVKLESLQNIIRRQAH